MQVCLCVCWWRCERKNEITCDVLFGWTDSVLDSLGVFRLLILCKYLMAWGYVTIPSIVCVKPYASGRSNFSRMIPTELRTFMQPSRCWIECHYWRGGFDVIRHIYK